MDPTFLAESTLHFLQGWHNLVFIHLFKPALRSGIYPSRPSSPCESCSPSPLLSDFPCKESNCNLMSSFTKKVKSQKSKPPSFPDSNNRKQKSHNRHIHALRLHDGMKPILLTWKSVTQMKKECLHLFTSVTNLTFDWHTRNTKPQK